MYVQWSYPTTELSVGVPDSVLIGSHLCVFWKSYKTLVTQGTTRGPWFAIPILYVGNLVAPVPKRGLYPRHTSGTWSENVQTDLWDFPVLLNRRWQSK